MQEVGVSGAVLMQDRAISNYKSLTHDFCHPMNYVSNLIFDCKVFGFGAAISEVRE
jgi:hypothetical protein